MNQLTLHNYTVSIEDKLIVQNVSLALQAGSLHVLMGPNGSGKSSLALSLMGHPTYMVQGEASLESEDLLSLPSHKRAQAGLFVSFQQPQEIPGLNIATYLKAIYEAKHGHIEPSALQEKIFYYLDLLCMDRSFYYRNVNEGFSGGQKKKFEVLQLLLLKPKVAILDEIDSGLDVDALKVIANALQIARNEHPSMTILLITHYQRLLDHISVDHVHLLMNGRLIKSGDYTLACQIEQQGYDQIKI